MKLFNRSKPGDRESLGRFSREELDKALTGMKFVDGPYYGERELPDGRCQYFAFFRREGGPRFAEGYYPTGFDFGPCLQKDCDQKAVMAWYCEEHCPIDLDVGQP